MSSHSITAASPPVMVAGRSPGEHMSGGDRPPPGPENGTARTDFCGAGRAGHAGCAGRAFALKRGQNFGSGVWDWTSSAASSFVSTDGGEPSSGCCAVSFMHATAITPTSAAAIA